MVYPLYLMQRNFTLKICLCSKELIAFLNPPPLLRSTSGQAIQVHVECPTLRSTKETWVAPLPYLFILFLLLLTSHHCHRHHHHHHQSSAPRFPAVTFVFVSATVLRIWQADTKALFYSCSSSCGWHFIQVEGPAAADMLPLTNSGSQNIHDISNLRRSQGKAVMDKKKKKRSRLQWWNAHKGKQRLKWSEVKSELPLTWAAGSMFNSHPPCNLFNEILHLVIYFMQCKCFFWLIWFYS